MAVSYLTSVTFGHWSTGLTGRLFPTKYEPSDLVIARYHSSDRRGYVRRIDLRHYCRSLLPHNFRATRAASVLDAIVGPRSPKVPITRSSPGSRYHVWRYECPLQVIDGEGLWGRSDRGERSGRGELARRQSSP